MNFRGQIKQSLSAVMISTALIMGPASAMADGPAGTNVEPQTGQGQGSGAPSQVIPDEVQDARRDFHIMASSAERERGYLEQVLRMLREVRAKAQNFWLRKMLAPLSLPSERPESDPLSKDFHSFVGASSQIVNRAEAAQQRLTAALAMSLPPEEVNRRYAFEKDIIEVSRDQLRGVHQAYTRQMLSHAGFPSANLNEPLPDDVPLAVRTSKQAFDAMVAHYASLVQMSYVRVLEAHHKVTPTAFTQMPRAPVSCLSFLAIVRNR